MNGKQLAVVLALIGAAAVFLGHESTSKVSQFEAWKAKHSISYGSQFEEAYREKIFLENLAQIEAHNSNEYRTYEKGVNQFTAMTQEEFVQTYLGTVVPEGANTIDSTDNLRLGDVNWQDEGAVTPIKNQGQCGSCWAFSTTGGLEGLSKVEYGTLESFSESQLVDCSSKYGNHGCNGGLMDNAFKFVKDNGIVHEDEYPYVAKQNKCKTTTGPFKISGYVDIKKCDDLATSLTGRPISVAVDASNWSSYRSGVFSNCKTSLNHGVTLVGMSDQYWLVKNSWGGSWGSNGNIVLK
jgi:C1A family cysteine protease